MTDQEKKGRKRASDSRFRRFLRKFLLISAFVIVIGLAVSHFLSLLLPENQMLTTPEQTVTSVLTPVQTGFSFLVDGIKNYFYTLKLRSNIEHEYNNLRDENENLRNEAMLVRELQTMLSQYQSISDEVRVNENLNPISARVIARESGNYFSVFVVNVGSNDGVNEFMAVTMDGALVGYTYDVKPSQCSVRTIIDSEASIAALLSNSRDQGTIRGTLDVDGNALCRMYYLPDDRLPRPGELVVTSGVGMSFPKGIPIGEVKESTRGMESNKSYVVVQPQADFQHIERVIVLRYQPDAVEVEQRASSNDSLNLSRLDTPRPVPTVHIGSEFFQLAPTVEPTATPAPTVIIDENGNEVQVTPVPQEEISPDYEYKVPIGSSTDESYGFTVSPMTTPSPSPTLEPLDLSVEDD